MSSAGAGESETVETATRTACPFEHSENLVEILGQIEGSLLLTTYQAGCVAAIGVSLGSLFVSVHRYERAMGLAIAADRIAIGGGPQIWYLQSMPALARYIQPAGKFDSCYVTRSSHVTAEIHSHEMAFAGPQLWFVNTLFSCLCTLHPQMSFLPHWKPQFVSAMAPEDRCHLNGLALENGRPRYVTALSQTDTAQGWRPVKAHGGVLIDVPGNAIVRTVCRCPTPPGCTRAGSGCSIPGPPGWSPSTRAADRSRPWPSSRASRVGSPSRALTPSSVCPGSANRPPLETCPSRKRDELKCGMAVVELASGKIASLFEFKEGIHEIFAVEVLGGTACPAISGPFVDKDNTQPIYTMPDNWAQNSPRSRHL